MRPSSARLVVTIVLLLFAWQVSVCQIETPQPSPKGKIEQRVGVADVTISYFRPGMKGRKIFGGLVPFNQEWRTGANNPTTMTFTDKVKLEGIELAAGTYALFTIPGEQEWTIIINKNSSGSVPRDPKEDLASFKVKPSRMATALETFTINITDIGTNSANIELAWEMTSVRFKMEFDVDTKVMAAIKKAMENPFSSVANTYYQSASYYFTAGKDNRTALEWVNKSLDLNNKPYWVWRLKSQIQAAMKDYKGAITSAETSKARAKEAGNEQFVRFNDEAIAEWKAMK